MRSVLFISIFFTALFAQALPTEQSTLFMGSGTCGICHIAAGGAFVTQAGEDISPTNLWRSTMMGNSSKDPFWQAKVTTEVDAHPVLQSIIETKCSTCHMPMGKTEAFFNGAESYAVTDGFADPLSLDGVSCTICHQIQNSNFGEESSFSGGYAVTDAHQIFGPYTFPTTMPMVNQTGYTPTFAEHISDSKLCATCHTLYTPYVNDNVEVVGYFPEQTPYLEWENSIYPEMGMSCQSCHMPAINESMKISASPGWLTTTRTPIYKHDFVGGNSFMLNLINLHRTEIGATATEDHFSTTLGKSNEFLSSTINLATIGKVENDSLVIEIMIENLAGHKFPTGFPSRRAWIHLTVQNENDALLFESGQWNDKGEIVNLDERIEPHYQVINQADQVQIYEAIMLDVNDDVTYTLLRGAKYGKDNRLVPKGFKDDYADYESVAVVGNATNDSNFGEDGSDKIIYKVPVSSLDNNFKIKTEVCYQSLAKPFADDLLEHNTDKVTVFKDYFDGETNAPVIIKSNEITVSKITKINEPEPTLPDKIGLFRNYPNPFNSSTTIEFEVLENCNLSLEIYNLRGNKVVRLDNDIFSVGRYSYAWNAKDENNLDVSSGIYFAILKSGMSYYELRLLYIQ